LTNSPSFDSSQSFSSSHPITPVFDAPLLLAEGKERLLVASDLHLGLEHELWLGGISIPSQTRKILSLLEGYLERIRPDRLLILGDLKHNVPKTSWQERREVPEFLRQLSVRVRVDIVSGNHDSNLADMAPLGVRVHPATGIVREGRGYFHGHTWPEEKVVRSGLMIAAHLHPVVRLKDPLGSFQTHSVWARAPIKSEVVEENYGFISSGEIIIMPAFNPLCGGLALNEPAEDLRGPLLSMADMEHARIYLLDGTDLGLLAEIKASQGRSF